MATPFFQLQNNSLQIQPNTPFSKKFLTLDASGNPIDVHTGYIVQYATLAPASDLNQAASPYDVSGFGTFTFDATGVTWTMPASTTAVLKPQTLHTNLVLTLSNDSGTTHSILAKAPVVIDPSTYSLS